MTKIDTLIVGAGLSGLTVAHKLRIRYYGHNFLLLEKEGRTGGAIRTYREDGYIIEKGPHGFLDNCPDSKVLLTEIGLDSECIQAPLSHFSRYIYFSGALRQIPQTPVSILKTSLVRWKSKFHILADLWKKPLSGEPTVARWIEYRFGPALLPFVDAALTGTYAGDIDRLAIDGVMPGIRALEKKYGSIIRGILARKNGPTNPPRRLSMPAMTSFPSGMQRLPDRLTEFFLPEVDIMLQCGIKKILKTANGWLVESEKGSHEATNLVLALPINAALALLRDIDNRMPISHVPEAWIATVAFSFSKDVRLPPGFGYLSPESEGRFSLGCLFSSNMFPGRAPSDTSLIEVLVGGRRHPERTELDDQTLIREAFDDVQAVLNLPDKPLSARVLRNSSGIPQAEQGFPELLSWKKKLLDDHQGLYICGFGWDGIGINDVIKAAGQVAENIMAGRQDHQKQTSVKGVYF
jgi:protoporphyrinogen/coproporphyrinogen III oxidase